MPVGERKDLFPGALEMMVLRALSQEQHIHRLSGDLLRVEEGSLYPALQRMLRSGLVKAQWEVSATGRRVRVYQITPRGRSHLEREISSFERMLEGIRLVLAPEES